MELKFYHDQPLRHKGKCFEHRFRRLCATTDKKGPSGLNIAGQSMAALGGFLTQLRGATEPDLACCKNYPRILKTLNAAACHQGVSATFPNPCPACCFRAKSESALPMC